LPNPAVTWLDLRPDDLTKARDFIRRMQEDGVIDELGFLGLLGRISDLLYPATTTLMQSARYFYFVAGIYRSLEREGVSASQVDRLARQRQDELREVLDRNGEKGVIGRLAKEQLRQFPSQIYWAAMKTLGMFTADLSEPGYRDQFDVIARARRGYADDDKTPQAAELPQFWDPRLPAASFLKEALVDGRMRHVVDPKARLRLSKAEALDLRSRILGRLPNSMFSQLLKQEAVDLDWPWDCAKLPDHLAYLVNQARLLSLFVRGVTLQYHAVVLEERRRRQLPHDDVSVTEQFKLWWTIARTPLAEWDSAQLVVDRKVADGMRRGSEGDRWFIDAWLSRLRLAGSAEALLNDAVARNLVKQRESRVKPGKARLKYENHLRRWQPGRIGSGVYQFSYRHHVASRFVDEILQALNGTT
jgi:hypothetical protein